MLVLTCLVLYIACSIMFLMTFGAEFVQIELAVTILWLCVAAILTDDKND